MSYRSVLAFSVLALVMCMGAASCDETDRYVYTAQSFDQKAGCLEAYRPVEVVPGARVSAVCPPTCMTVNGTVMISSVCPPLPDIARALPDDSAECLAALDAARLEASCGSAVKDDATADGGADSSDAGPHDAGDDATDATDASADDARIEDARADREGG